MAFPVLDPDRLRRQVGGVYYSRGKRYADAGRVLGFEVQRRGDAWLVSGMVDGTEPYRQAVHLEPGTDGGLLVDGECTCPVGYNCKHVAALLIELSRHGDRSLPRSAAGKSYMRWVEQLLDADAPMSWPVEAGSEVLLYMLEPDERRPSGLSMALGRSRVLANDRGYGKPRRIGWYELEYQVSSDIMQPLDREILPLVERLASRRNSRVGFEGAFGAVLLRKLVRTGRLHWRDRNGPPLRTGAPRVLEADWQGGDGFMRLAISTLPTGGRILPVEPPMYVDVASGEVGKLEVPAGLDHRLLSVLLEAPAVPEEDAGPLSRALLELFPNRRLPLPVPLQAQIVQERPLPVLLVSGGAGMPRGRLYFEYAGTRLPANGDTVARLGRGDSLLEIHRDSQAERAALDTLLGLGLQVLEEGPPLLGFDADSEPAAVAAWWQFLEGEVPALRRQGWCVEFEEGYELAVFDSGQIEAGIEDHEHWFDLQLGVEVEGQRVDLVPLLADLVAGLDSPDALDGDGELMLDMGDSRWLRLPSARVRPLLANLFDLFNRKGPARPTGLRLNRMDAVRLEGIAPGVAHWRGGEALRELGERLRTAGGPAGVSPPDGLQAELRPYQQAGLGWLQFLRETGFGGILADDMGLGKTLQTLAHILVEKEAGRLQQPALVVAPTSLMANWRREAARFAPALSVLTLQGPERKQYFSTIDRHDLVLTTYPLLPRDAEFLAGFRYHLLILDEAQTIKNPRAKAARVAREIRADHRLCLTGTPMENHLGELWSLFHFLAPGFLGDERTFRTQFRTPIEVHGDQERRRTLQQRIAPFMLRRTKQAVAAELPEKTVIVRSVALDRFQADLYESVRAAMDERVREALAGKGLARSQITVLDALLKLRQICCDPRLAGMAQTGRGNASAKLALLMQMLPELLDEGRRVLLFSQFTSMLALIAEQLDALGIPYSRLTGKTRDREGAIERFRGGEVNVFLVSLKAGGVGLNLQEADTVIHYDPWWNPAAENQATDRAHRIGQTSKVFVYKLVAEGTVEEKILALQARKAALADGLYRESREGALAFDEDDLRELLRPPA